MTRFFGAKVNKRRLLWRLEPIRLKARQPRPGLIAFLALMSVRLGERSVQVSSAKIRF